MLTTFVIALREGLEASLIVGIIAAFLRRQERTDALRSMWLGVGLAVALCVAVAVVLRIVDNELPHRQQEGLETVVALVAVAMVTYMIVWMTEHARDLKGQLQHQAAGALAQGSAMALVAMAFLAVLREGFETAVFLLAAFNDATDPAAAGLGVVLGLVAALALGFGIYRGGLRLNLSRFFRATGVVLVLVAAGLVASSLHTAAEAGWVVGGQAQALDLSAIIRPGTVWESLITGILGIHPQPTVIEVVGWLLYAIPMLLIVLVPDAVRPRVRATVAGVAVVAAPIVLLVGTLGGDKETSTAVASAGGAGQDGQRRDHQRGLHAGDAEARLWADDLRGHQQGLVEGDRVRGDPGQPDAGGGRERRRRTDAALLAHAPARSLHAALQRRRPRERLADGERRARQRGARARPAARRRRLSRLPRARDRLARRRRGEPALRAGPRRPRRGAARLRGRARALRARRARGRVLRRPRPAHRRARQRRPQVQVDGLSPDRAQAVGGEDDRRAPRSSPTAS